MMFQIQIEESSLRIDQVIPYQEDCNEEMLFKVLTTS